MLFKIGEWNFRIGLEFYQRQRRLLLPQDVPWEIWQMDLTVVRATDDGLFYNSFSFSKVFISWSPCDWSFLFYFYLYEQISGYLSSLADSLADELTSLHLNFISAINQSIYLPKVPSKSELLNVFDDSISDCNPYLYRIVRPQLSDGSYFSVADFRVIKNEITSWIQIFSIYSIYLTL